MNNYLIMWTAQNSNQAALKRQMEYRYKTCSVKCDDCTVFLKKCRNTFNLKIPIKIK